MRSISILLLSSIFLVLISSCRCGKQAIDSYLYSTVKDCNFKGTGSVEQIIRCEKNENVEDYLLTQYCLPNQIFSSCSWPPTLIYRSSCSKSSRGCPDSTGEQTGGDEKPPYYVIDNLNFLTFPKSNGSISIKFTDSQGNLTATIKKINAGKKTLLLKPIFTQTGFMYMNVETTYSEGKKMKFITKVYRSKI